MIGIIGAMDAEIALFQTGLDSIEETQVAGISFFSGRFQGKEVVLCKSGVGKVNASVCTQLLIHQFNVKKIIFTGVAGALHPQLNIGDIVISKECVHHDMDATALGYSRGEIPYAASSVFEADQMLIQQALQACKETSIGNVRIGRVLSGDQFIADLETVKFLHKELQGDCTEMEGAAVAQVCHMNKTPFVIVRSMSDKADGSASVNFSEFTKLAAENSFVIVSKMV